MRGIILSGAVAAVLLMGCSANPRPIVDTKNVDMDKYYADLQECEAYQKEIEISKGVGKGAAVGAAVGGLIGALDGDVAEGAAVGAVLGGAESGVEAAADREEVAKNCLKGRGYAVLN